MKVKSDADTTGVKKISLIDQLGASISYNAAAKEKPWGNLSMNLRLKLKMCIRDSRYGEQEQQARREQSRLVTETMKGYAELELNAAFPFLPVSYTHLKCS